MYIALALALALFEKRKSKNEKYQIDFCGRQFLFTLPNKMILLPLLLLHGLCWSQWIEVLLWLCVVWALHCDDCLEFSGALNSIHLNSTVSMICIQLPNAVLWLDNFPYNDNNMHLIQKRKKIFLLLFFHFFLILHLTQWLNFCRLSHGLWSHTLQAIEMVLKFSIRWHYRDKHEL